MNRSFAIGDLHGCNKTLNQLLFKELEVHPSDQLYFLGDYIDRGPDSLGVIQTILGLMDSGYQVHCLRGNHEQLMIDSTTSLTAYFQWLLNGGETTMDSFKQKRFQDFPQIYIDFFHSTQLYIELDHYILVHAGLNFDRENIFEDTDAMLWARLNKSTEPRLNTKRLIHGHTPMTPAKIRSQNGNCINIDSGCVFKGKHKNLGYLTALNLNTLDYHFSACVDF